MSEIRISEIGLKIKLKKPSPKVKEGQSLTLSKREQRLVALLLERDTQIDALKKQIQKHEMQIQKARQMVLGLGVVSDDTWQNWMRTKEVSK